VFSGQNTFYQSQKMKKIEPEWDQWTDQNHVPFCPGSHGKSQEITNTPRSKKSFSLLWHFIEKLFTPSSKVRSGQSKPSGPYLS
jgi:hypothetical protein